MWQHQSDMTEYVKQQGFDVRPLIYDGDATPLYNADYVNWLPVSQNQDAEQFLTIVNQADLVIVDHYSLSLDWEQSVKAILHCQVMAIDDIERSHHCDVLLDQTLNRHNRDYMSLCPANTELYTGTQDALLNPSFNQLKQQKQALTANKQYRLLIAIGGIDNSGVTYKVLSSLIASPIPEITSVSVIINPKSPFYDILGKVALFDIPAGSAVSKEMF